MKDPVNIIIGNVNIHSLPRKLDQFLLLFNLHLNGHSTYRRSGGGILMRNK